MKLIIAVIKPFKLEEVREKLTEIGVQGLMVSEIKGYGRQAILNDHFQRYIGADTITQRANAPDPRGHRGWPARRRSAV